MVPGSVRFSSRAMSSAEVLANFLGEQNLNAHQSIGAPFRTRAPSPKTTSGPIVGKNQENSLRRQPSEAIGIVQERICVQHAHRELTRPRLDLGVAERRRMCERQEPRLSKGAAGEAVSGIKRQVRESQHAGETFRIVFPDLIRAVRVSLVISTDLSSNGPESVARHPDVRLYHVPR